MKHIMEINTIKVIEGDLPWKQAIKTKLEYKQLK